jgi:hypothetical protein
MHAHRCKNCARQGISTVWIHGDEMAGSADAHTCPKCGQTEWEKWLVPAGQLPRQQHAPHAGESLYVVSLVEIVKIAMYLFMAAYFTFVAAQLWELWQTRKLPKA